MVTDAESWIKASNLIFFFSASLSFLLLIFCEQQLLLLRLFESLALVLVEKCGLYFSKKVCFLFLFYAVGVLTFCFGSLLLIFSQTVQQFTAVLSLIVHQQGAADSICTSILLLGSDYLSGSS